MTEPEIATAYRRRFAEASARQERVDGIEFERLEIFADAGEREPLLTVTLVPEIAGTYSIDQRAFDALRNETLGPPEIGRNVQRTSLK